MNARRHSASGRALAAGLCAWLSLGAGRGGATPSPPRLHALDLSAPPSPPPTSRSRTLGLAFLSVGGVLVLGGIGFGAGAYLEGRALSSDSAHHRLFDPTRESLGKGFQTAAICAGVIGGSLAILGTTFLLVSPGRARANR